MGCKMNHAPTARPAARRSREQPGGGDDNLRQAKFSFWEFLLVLSVAQKLSPGDVACDTAGERVGRGDFSPATAGASIPNGPSGFKVQYTNLFIYASDAIYNAVQP